jgi:hypothetical protein
VTDRVERLGTAGEMSLTTSRVGTTSAGRIEADSASASRCESPKNRGKTSVAFSGLRARASSAMVDKQRLPERSASATSGWAWMSSAAVLRWKAALFESLSSWRRKAQRDGYPSSLQARCWSNVARVTRKSAIAFRSLR